MKLYLADTKKLSSFTLPEKVSESFLFTYTPASANIEVYLNIYAKDGNWYLKNTNDISINNSQEDTKLTSYETYVLKIKGTMEEHYLYTYETYNDNYDDILIDSTKPITIGSESSNTITYTNNYTDLKQLAIIFEQNEIYVQANEKSPTKAYINGKVIDRKINLNCGDTIFLNNLKLIWMNSFIRVYKPVNSVTYLGVNIKSKENVDNSKYLVYDIKENNIGLYKDNDYFFKNPRLTYAYDEESITIDAPPSRNEKDDIPVIFNITTGLTMVVTSLFTAYRSILGYQQGKTNTTELVMALISASVMLFCSFLIPKLLKNYNEKLVENKNRKLEKRYSEYLAKKNNEILKVIKFESQTLYDNNPSSKECYERIIGIKNNIWEREIQDKDFLTLRVGIGNVPSSIKIDSPKEKFEITNDELLERAKSVANTSKELVNVPVTMSLCENYISSIVSDFNYTDDYINGIITQILSLHNPKDLKIIFLTSEKNKDKWDYLKLIPHIYSEDRSIRFFATNEDEAKKILGKVEEIYANRIIEIKNKKNEINDEIDTNDYYKSFSPYYLIITDNYRKYKNIDFLNKIIKFNTNVGFSILMLEKSLRSLPNECRKYTYVTDKNSVIFEKTYTKGNQLNFNTELVTNLNMHKVAKELSNIPLQAVSDIYNLPTTLPFLEMYNVGNIEQLNILNRWNTNNSIISLSCPIGVQPSGELFKLDLHEKAHGPHGLIAGSTGSGKSEFIITYILSMCVNYHPDDVQFVLIDYKGGGLAGAFENRETGMKIPHLAGTITNLDVSEMNRTLVSINSELKRRQRKFNEAREKLGESTIDIYKYQKYYHEGLLKDPIPHLFIISDEFAELKSQQPDFMDELISTARIGRSLGVHLILATQKPSGVVNDQIWSNSRFKICLKVQTIADSNEMLKRPEAASIKETGRFYLQVGYDELFELGQSAWTGANYIPSEKVIKKVDDSINFIDNTGDIIKSTNNLIVNPTINKNIGDQLTNIVKYLNSIAKENGIKNKQLWLDSIPGEIYLQDLMNKYNYNAEPYVIEGIIGEYDDPVQQKQGLLTVDLTNTGNTLIYGIPGSGKENLLTTFISSICSRHTTDEVNFYIMDFGAETLSKFKDFPQVGDIVFINEKEKINNLYAILNKEINKRKTLFSDYMGSYNNYIKYSGKKLPNIIVVLHGYDSFNDNLPLIAEKWESLIKDASKFGITFIMTNSLSTGIRSKLLQVFPNKLTLKLGNNDDYRYVVGSPKTLIPANYFGRGIAKLDSTVEFQTAYICKPDDMVSTIAYMAKTLKASITKKAPNIPVLPDFMTVDKLMNKEYQLNSIPVGISKNKLSICNYDFAERNYTPVISSGVSDHIHFLYGLIEVLKQVPKTKIRIIDVLKLYNNSQGVDVYNNDFDTLIQQIKLEALDDKNLKVTNIFIIIGLGAFKNNVSTKTKKHFEDVFENLKEYKHNKFIIYDDYNSYKSLESSTWFNANVDSTNGIWLGDNASSQLAVKMPNLSTEERRLEFNQMGFVVKNSSHTIVRYIVDKEFDNEK